MDVEIVEDDNELVNIFETRWYKDISTTITAGDTLKVYRENHSLTTSELAIKLRGLSTQDIYEMECNEREISFEVAEQLSQLFDVSIERFLINK